MTAAPISAVTASYPPTKREPRATPVAIKTTAAAETGVQRLYPPRDSDELGAMPGPTALQSVIKPLQSGAKTVFRAAAYSIGGGFKFDVERRLGLHPIYTPLSAQAARVPQAPCSPTSSTSSQADR